MRTLLVTGGAGFIGSNFIRYWLATHTDDQVINFDALTYAGNLENLSDVEKLPNYKFVQGNLCDRSALESVFSAHSIDTVVNFAAESHVDRSITGPEEFVMTNVHGTFTLLDVAKNKWGDSNECRFVHVSTDEVYGSLESHDEPFSETTRYAPNSPYSASKAASDHLVRAYHHTYKLPVLTTNCSNNYGPYQFPEKLIPLVILNALDGKPLPIYGDGKNIRDWLYVDDHCRAIDKVLSQGTIGSTYNIGGNNEIENIEIVRSVCRILDDIEPAGTKREELITFVTDRPGHDKRYAINATKILSELGWAPSLEFDEGIRRTVQWYISNREWCDRVRDGQYRDYYRNMYG